MQKYNPKIVEAKWQEYWEKNQIFKIDDSSDKEKFYVLDMFPYPSGAGLHVGHPKGYIATDIIARLKMMQGYNVLHPMGWDAFGLPAENYAIKNKVHPAVAVEKNIKIFKKQLGLLGFTYDWSREVNTTDPNYYKWTQWTFLQMFKHGLAYESYEPINWCPTCQTGLANEDLENGKCERCGSEIEHKPLRQWVLKITKYADRLLNDLDKLPNWPESIKTMQKEWIGRKEGINIEYQIENNYEKIIVFTTRPDTNFGATFVVLGPEHPLALKIVDDSHKDDVEKYIHDVKNKSRIERVAEGRKKTGIFTGVFCINNLNGYKMPIWIADYVLGDVGTGAIVGVPGHDKRDFEFAFEFDIPIKRVVVAKDGDTTEITKTEHVQEHEGVMINSDFLNGLDIHDATLKIMDYLEEKGWGKKKVNYKLRDWVFSRQRYWGEPIPLVKCEKCDWVPIPEEQLPLKLPEVEKYQPTGTGESPLANITDWVNTACPKCGGPARRETNTMPQWAGSCWYYLAYCMPGPPIDHPSDKRTKRWGYGWDKSKINYWNPVDVYVGGAEHATRHLIYARFWHKFLFDIGAVADDEPFIKLQNVGLVLAEDGKKMSKRWGNIINPDDIIEQYGADAMRLYEMFMSPFDQPCAWNTHGVVGMRRFLDKVWDLQSKLDNVITSDSIDTLLHQTIKKVTEDIEKMRFNTAISQLMILVNELSKEKSLSTINYSLLIKLLSPFAPHLCEEIWSLLGNKVSIAIAPWPQYDAGKIVDEKITLAVQVNGKLRDAIEVNSNIAEDDAKITALSSDRVQKYLEGKKPKKVIYVKDKLISIVV